MRRAIVAAILFSSAAASAEPTELKGIAIGASLAEVSAAHPGLKCSESADGKFGCLYFSSYGRGGVKSLDTLAGLQTRVWDIQGFGGKVASVRVTLQSDYFARIAGALQEKMGPATESKPSKMKTRAGVEYDQLEQTWRRSDGAITVSHYAGDIKTMAVRMTSPQADEMNKAEREEQNKKGATDL